MWLKVLVDNVLSSHVVGLRNFPPNQFGENCVKKKKKKLLLTWYILVKRTIACILIYEQHVTSSTQDPNSMTTFACLALLSTWTSESKLFCPWEVFLSCLTIIFNLFSSWALNVGPSPPTERQFSSENPSVAAWSSAYVNSLFHPISGRLFLQIVHVENRHTCSAFHAFIETPVLLLLVISCSWSASVWPISWWLLRGKKLLIPAPEG